MITVPSRPFSRELITGLMLPDGIFESTLGNQEMVAMFENIGADTPLDAYVESTSHPALLVTPGTRHVTNLPAGASTFLSWTIDVSAVPPGQHLVSFVIDTPSGRWRRIKKIFVTQVLYDPSTQTFTATTPEGRMDVRLGSLRGPRDQPCCPRPNEGEQRISYLEYVREGFSGHKTDFTICLPGYVLDEVAIGLTPTTPYPGQYGPLAFEDPWWKVVLCIIAVVLLIAAGIAAASGEGGSVTVTTGGTGSTPDPTCGCTASGGSSSYVVAGLVAAAAAAATAAGLSDVRDPIRRGQDHTPPGDGELTLVESVEVKFSYPEPVALGRPFRVGADWRYERTTTGGTYAHSASDVTANVHVVSEQHITAPDVIRAYREEPFIVKAQFLNAEGKPYVGPGLFVQCILAGPSGQYVSFPLVDDGGSLAEGAVDGTYTGQHYFSGKDVGVWLYYVIAQDVNLVPEGTSPEDAAQVIGGVVVSHSLTLTFDGGSCPLVPDGHVQVITG